MDLLKKSVLGCLAMSSLILHGQQLAETLSSADPCCLCGPSPSHFNIRHLEYQGIGFNEGYTSLDLFLENSAPWKCSNYLFLDLRGHIFNNGQPAANAGFGWRYLFDSLCHAVGIHTYYDYRKTKRKHYNQIGVGVEYLNPTWEFRANGYIPVGSKMTHPFDLKFDHFSGNNFFLSGKREFAMSGADAEIGWHFRQWENVDLYAGVGPYYFTGPIGKSAIGGQARLAARITPYVKIEVGDSYDQVFHNRFQAQLTLSMPFGPRFKPDSSKCCSCMSQNKLQEWVHDSPKRAEIIVLDTQRETSIAVDPATGLPFFLIFINNTSSSNGTFESPYSSFATAVSNPGDTIYVFPGDGTTTGMNAGIVLKDNQRFLGSGVSHEFQTSLGAVTIPAQSTALPLITSPAAVVTLALNNEVSGFAFSGGGTVLIPAVLGSFSGVASSVNINRNQFLFTAGNSIGLSQASSQVNIAISDNFFQFPFGKGIEITPTGTSNITANILGNLFTNTAGNPIHILADGSATVTSNIDRNTLYLHVTGNPFGVLIETAMDAIQTSQITNNAILSNLSNVSIGIVLNAQTSSTLNSQIRAQISGNITHGCPGILISNAVLAAGSIEATIQKNAFEFFSSTATPAIRLVPDGPGAITATIANNGFFNAATIVTYGIHLSLSANSIGQTTLNIVNNQFHEVTTAFLCNASRRTDVDIINNRFVNHSASPSVSLTTQTGIATARIERNDFSDSIVSFTCQPQLGAMTCLRLDGNVGGAGYYLDSSVGGTIQVESPTSNSNELNVLGSITFVPPGTCQ